MSTYRKTKISEGTILNKLDLRRSLHIYVYYKIFRKASIIKNLAYFYFKPRKRKIAAWIKKEVNGYTLLSKASRKRKTRNSKTKRKKNHVRQAFNHRERSYDPGLPWKLQAFASLLPPSYMCIYERMRVYLSREFSSRCKRGGWLEFSPRFSTRAHSTVYLTRPFFWHTYARLSLFSRRIWGESLWRAYSFCIRFFFLLTALDRRVILLYIGVGSDFFFRLAWIWDIQEVFFWEKCSVQISVLDLDSCWLYWWWNIYVIFIVVSVSRKLRINKCIEGVDLIILSYCWKWRFI